MHIGLDSVLSEQALDLHKDYLRNLKLKYSIIEKSLPEVVGKSMREISKMKIKDKNEILSLLCDIRCHELYFTSYGKEFQSSSAVKKRFRTEASFMYELLEKTKSLQHGFIAIYFNKGFLDYDIASINLFLRAEPILTVDLCEHAYFLDFGFEKEEYLKKIISRLNINHLDKFLLKRD